MREPDLELDEQPVATGPHVWTPDEDQQLREGVEFGCTIEELADQFEVTVPVVALKLAGMGLAAPSEAEVG
ncbi:hypothetical protein [Angustibacter aerolatus]